MATLESLAQEYANYLRYNRDNPSAATEIINRINSITYTSSGSKISSSDKEELIDLIEKELSPKRKTRDGYLIVESEDSTQLIRLIQMVKSGTSGK